MSKFESTVRLAVTDAGGDISDSWERIIIAAIVAAPAILAAISSLLNGNRIKKIDNGQKYSIDLLREKERNEMEKRSREAHRASLARQSKKARIKSKET
jgi:hypothetical protein